MSTSMTSKERVLAAFNHREPDRVPINYIANPGIDKSLKRHLGILENDDEALRQRLGVDFRGIWIPYTGPRLHQEIHGRHVDGEWGVITRWVDHGTGGYWDYSEFPLAKASDETIATWPMPSPDHYDLSIIKERCLQNEGYAIHIGDPGLSDILNGAGFLFGMERVLTGLMVEDHALLSFIKRKSDIRLELTRRMLEAGEGKVDFLWIGEDLGSQRGPLISLDLYRRHVKPYQKQFTDLAKSFDIPVMIHSCGSSSWAYEDFIEIGISVIDTLQPEATDMQPEYLKSKYGDRLAFHGCISTAGPVSFGTVDEVVADTKHILEVMMPGGGYCLSPTHALQDNSPVENVVAMYETAQKAGRYA